MPCHSIYCCNPVIAISFLFLFCCFSMCFFYLYIQFINAPSIIVYISPTHVWFWALVYVCSCFFCLLLYFLFSRHSISQVSFVSLRLTLFFTLTYALHIQRHSFDIWLSFFYVLYLHLHVIIIFSLYFSLFVRLELVVALCLFLFPF